MNTELYTELAWLPKPPKNFSSRVKAIDEGDNGPGSNLGELAGFRLNELQLNKLATALNSAICTGLDLKPLRPLKVGLVSNSTTEFLTPCIAATGLRYGFALDVEASAYGQVMQHVLDPGSELYRSNPDYVMVLLDYRGLPFQAVLGDAQDAKSAVQAALDQIATIIATIEKNSNAIGIFQTVARPAEPLFGSLDFSVPGTLRQLTADFNMRLATTLADTRHLLLDTAGVAETVGLANWHDPSLWTLAKAPFSNSMLPLFADHILRLVAASRGQSRRCLVMDLDNTLWGGVIGDDGMNGIRLAEGDAVGEAHRDVQQYALKMRERGVVLAVSSKNDDGVAREVFRDHNEMLLREDHIAVFQANWQDKASNIRAISEEISLGLASLAFIDDNPAERGLVRENVPSVAVPELPEDPAYYVRTFAASGVFEAVSFSNEDKKRADDYQSNAKRLALKASSTDLEGYLKSLEMQYVFRPFDAMGRTRIAQLINKSNQFNLTTRRYSEADVTEMENDPNILGMQIRLQDRFADNGMISVVICRKEDDCWDVDTWLMSCRVLGRNVERTVMQVLREQASSSGIEKIRGCYSPTNRNSMVEKHYERLGFNCVTEDEVGATHWEINVNEIPVEDVNGVLDVRFE